jgi:HTH-type transcriptional regulator/antitoxin HigA
LCPYNREYENKNYSIPESSPLEVLHHLMDVKEIKQIKLVGILGSKGVVSEWLMGNVTISKAQAKR